MRHLLSDMNEGPALFFLVLMLIIVYAYAVLQQSCRDALMGK